MDLLKSLSNNLWLSNDFQPPIVRTILFAVNIKTTFDLRQIDRLRPSEESEPGAEFLLRLRIGAVSEKRRGHAQDDREEYGHNRPLGD